MLLHRQRELETVIQIGGLFEPSPSLEPTLDVVLAFGSGDPAYVLAGVESETLVSLFSGDEAEAVVAYENTACAALSGVSLHCFFEGEDGGREDGMEGFLVYGHLDGDVGEVGVDGGGGERAEGGEVFRVGVVVCDGTDDHGEVLNDLEAEELGRW